MYELEQNRSLRKRLGKPVDRTFLPLRGACYQQMVGEHQLELEIVLPWPRNRPDTAADSTFGIEHSTAVAVVVAVVTSSEEADPFQMVVVVVEEDQAFQMMDEEGQSFQMVVEGDQLADQALQIVEEC